MWYPVIMLVLLVIAAVLEVGGDAAIRHGILRTSTPWLLAGALALVSYGFVVNTNRLIDFGRLMGLYITVFFVVSQVIDVAAFGGRPSASLLVGGAFIVIGGLVIQLGAP
jgi:small multidrug resistance family-3 protein